MDQPSQIRDARTDEVLQLTIKRKWQIALRRYILENNPSVSYAAYFGLPAVDLRKWIQLQFKEGMTWDNFGKAWNLSQKVPASLFNLREERDLTLCWHFINITVQEIKENPAVATLESFATKQYFRKLYETTGFEKFNEMCTRITQIETIDPASIKPLESFIRENQKRLEILREFDGEDFSRLNRGEDLHALITEKEIIRKYGS